MFRHRILGMVILFVMLFSQSVPRAMAAGCDSAQFVSDLTIPDGSSVAPGAAFTKTWRLLNNGTCTWDPSYNLVWAGGDAMGPSLMIKLPVSVPPGQMLDLSVNLVAPGNPGHYKSLWKLSQSIQRPVWHWSLRERSVLGGYQRHQQQRSGLRFRCQRALCPVAERRGSAALSWNQRGQPRLFIPGKQPAPRG